MEKRVPILTLFAQYAHIVFVVLSLLYALLWLPFSIQDLYLDPSLNPHIVDLARIVSLGMCLSILVFCTHNRSFQIRFSAVDVLLGMLWGYIFVSSVWIAHNDGITPEIVELVALIGLYAILRTLDTYSKWISLVVLVLCGFLQAVYGLMQLYGIYASNHGLFKMTGTFLNPGPFGGYMALCFSLTFALYRFRKQCFSGLQIENERIIKALEYGLLVVLSACVIVLPALHSRAALLSVVLVSIAIYGKGIGRMLNKRHGFFISIGVLLCALVCAGLYFAKKDSSDGRLLIWKASLPMSVIHPIEGIGVGKYRALYMEYQAEYFKQHANPAEILLADETNIAYNTLLKFGIEAGLVGLVLLFFLSYTLLKSLPNNLLGKIGAMGLLSVLVFSMFSYPEDVLLLKIATVLCLAIIPNTNNFLLQIKITQNRMIWAKILIVGVAVGFFFLYYQQVQSFAQGLVFWKKATTAYQGQQYDTAIENYQKAYPVLKNNGTYLVAYGKALQIHEKPDKAIVILTKASQYLQNTILHTALGNAYEQQNKFAKAEAAYKKAQEMIPHRFYAPYLLAKLYIAQGDLKNAEKASRNIFEKKEKVHSAAVREIRFELQNALRALQQKVEATASQASLPLPSPIKKGGMQN